MLILIYTIGLIAVLYCIHRAVPDWPELIDTLIGCTLGAAASVLGIAFSLVILGLMIGFVWEVALWVVR
jgi:hypothetical protein